MPLDLAPFRRRIGLEPDDESRDDDITAALDVAVAFAERYCDRGIVRQEAEDEFYIGKGHRLFLYRYPIVGVPVVSVENVGEAVPVSSYRLFETVGEIWPHAAWQGAVKVTYTGGYEPLPPDLAWAIGALFDTMFAEMFPSEFGGSGPVIVPGSGEVKSVTLFGVGSVSYDVGSTAVSAGDLAESGVLITPGSRLAFILDSYRRQHV
ncbi:MAG: hypothetical protein ACE37J_12245 [Pikeienuella sp.]|uniref:hypothetical protein n=1 Tax=Pikeienuella sp. TaxID=2831957 RepID=UPI00391A22D9